MKVSDLYGLILAGGKSTRMGRDKLSIDYHGKPQLDYLLEVVNECVTQTFVSKRPDQTVDFKGNVVEDAFDVQGPLNGLLSAHDCFPDKAWLAIAIDMPLVNENTIRKLIENRNPKRLATAYKTAYLPEPLAAIWEPHALARLLENLNSGTIVYPRKFLIENEIEVVEPKHDYELANINSPKDLERIKSIIGKNDSNSIESI